MYDAVVIGSGVSGLYFARKCSSKNVLVLEKTDRIGGRTYNVDFKDVKVPLGAGISVIGKDDVLMQLLREVSIDYRSGFLDMTSEEGQKVVQKLYNNLKAITPEMTFLDFMNTVLTKEEVAIYKRDNGFTDLYEADAMSTMLFYDVSENFTKYLVSGVNWSELIDRMKVGVNIKTNCEALSITGNHPHFQVHTKDQVFDTKHVVIATTISGIQKLLGDPIYNRIRAQPFMRVYGSFSGRSLAIMKKKFTGMFVVGGLLHLLTDMQKSVWMIAYTDGEDAVRLHQMLQASEETKVMEQELLETCGVKVKVDDVMYHFWQEGVHYYTPGGVVDFEHLQNPEPGIYVVGEAVAMSQGWVGGALESVEDIL